ncbi:hypothetical protein OG21DRAFT_1481311 [Imleria badia]|nr:hypothetical protein OG21DRAFT_1481311 [Imleria badia]
MPPRLTFEYNPLSYAYPDDESPKEVFFQASNGTPIAAHLCAVLLYWANKVFSDGEEVWQVVRLDRREDTKDVYRYVYPDMIVVDGEYQRLQHQMFLLGEFSRDEREAVLEYAEDVGYDARSEDEEESLRWMSELLERMVKEGLVAHGIVDAIREGVALP